MYIRQNYWEYYFLTGAVHYGNEVTLKCSLFDLLKTTLHVCVLCIPPEDHTKP